MKTVTPGLSMGVNDGCAASGVRNDIGAGEPSLLSGYTLNANQQRAAGRCASDETSDTSVGSSVSSGVVYAGVPRGSFNSYSNFSPSTGGIPRYSSGLHDSGDARSIDNAFGLGLTAGLGISLNKEPMEYSEHPGMMYPSHGSEGDIGAATYDSSQKDDENVFYNGYSLFSEQSLFDGVFFPKANSVSNVSASAQSGVNEGNGQVSNNAACLSTLNSVDNAHQVGKQKVINFSRSTLMKSTGSTGPNVRRRGANEGKFPRSSLMRTTATRSTEGKL